MIRFGLFQLISAYFGADGKRKSHTNVDGKLRQTCTPDKEAFIDSWAKIHVSFLLSCNNMTWPDVLQKDNYVAPVY